MLLERAACLGSFNRVFWWRRFPRGRMSDSVVVMSRTVMALVGRRAYLAGALGIAAALVVAVLAACSSPVNTDGARTLHRTIASRFVHGAMALTLVTPAGGGAHRLLLVFLRQ